MVKEGTFHKPLSEDTEKKFQSKKVLIYFGFGTQTQLLNWLTRMRLRKSNSHYIGGWPSQKLTRLRKSNPPSIGWWPSQKLMRLRKSNSPSIGWWPSQKLLKTEIERAVRPEWNIAAAAEFIKLTRSLWEFLFFKKWRSRFLNQKKLTKKWTFLLHR